MSEQNADSHEARVAALRALVSGGKVAPTVGLVKSTSNLFRDRDRRTPAVDISHFANVIRVRPELGTVDVEGMATYAALVDATLVHGLMPCVVPELKSITVGGALAGVGIEASSFKFGLVHETVTSVDVLCSAGDIVHCTPDNEHRDLFFGFPNSYGTLGYALRTTVRTAPVKRFVALEHVRFTDPARYFDAIGRHCSDLDIDFLDGTVFAPNEMYLTLARFVDEAPSISDYSFEQIYYKSIRAKRQDHLSTKDFIWRWDADWFWCSRQVGAQHPLLRRLFGRDRLNSITYQRIMRWNARWGLTRKWAALTGRYRESVIQDVDIPLPRAGEYLEFMLTEIPILPIWICPIRRPQPDVSFPLYPMKHDVPYINFGFWDVVDVAQSTPQGAINRKIESMVGQLGGIKSLYSDSYYTRQEFWNIYDAPAYRTLKSRYDPNGLRGDLFEKTCRLNNE